MKTVTHSQSHYNSYPSMTVFSCLSFTPLWRKDHWRSSTVTTTMAHSCWYFPIYYSHPNLLRTPVYFQTLVEERALEIIENHDSSDPLFLMFASPLPHTPLEVGKRRFYLLHDDAIKWKYFPRYWPFVSGKYRWPMDSPHRGPVTQSFDGACPPHRFFFSNYVWQAFLISPPDQ